MESAKSFVVFLSVFLMVMTFYIKVTEVYFNTVSLRRKAPKTSLLPPVNNHVCTDVLEIGKRSKNMSYVTDMAVEMIARRKRKKLFVSFPFYEVLSYESPSMIRKVSDGSGLIGTNITLAQKWRLEQVEGQLAHLSCPLRQFTAQDISRCVRNRRRQALNTTHIAYVGDSRVRQQVEVLIDLLRDLQPRITTYLGEVLTPDQFLGLEGLMHWEKYKHDFRVECVGVPGLLVEFHWAALIEKDGAKAGQDRIRIGAKHLLQRWIKASREDLPDVIILNTGAWQLLSTKGTILEQIDETAIMVMKKIRPLLQQLAARTNLVWALPDPFKEYISHVFSQTGHYTQQTNKVLEWLLNAQIALQPPGVTVWDSFLPIAFAAMSDCMEFFAAKISENDLSRFSNFLSFASWQCFERMHWTGKSTALLRIFLQRKPFFPPMMEYSLEARVYKRDPQARS